MNPSRPPGPATILPSPDPGFRSALLARTTRQVRIRRVRARRLRVLAALLLFGSGVLVGVLSGSRLKGDPSWSLDPVAAEGGLDPAEPEAGSLPPVDPTSLERALARVAPSERPRRWSEFGNAYLAERPDAALYCYRRSLEVAARSRSGRGESAEDLSPHDSWLLRALKVARN